jgi:hypothetical protein
VCHVEFVFWDVLLCGSVVSGEHISSIFRVEEYARSMLEGEHCLPCAACRFLLSLLFNPEDGGRVFLCRICEPVLNYTVLQLEKIIPLIVLYSSCKEIFV